MTDLYEILLKFQAAIDGGLDIRLGDVLEVAQRDPYIDIFALHDRVIDLATRRGPAIQRDSESLASAKGRWQALIEGEGGRCPCCGRWGKVYRRPLNARMAAAMIWLSQNGGLTDWVHLPTKAPRWITRSYQTANLRWWGLLERKPNDPEVSDTSTSGLWRLTQKGIDWINGRTTVPKFLWTYDDAVVREDEPLITVQECLTIRSSFSYTDMMAGRFDGLDDEE